MAFKQFPATLRVKVAETGELVPAGGVTPSRKMELQYLRLVFFSSGVAAGTEQFRVKLFADQALTKLQATSNWSTIANIAGFATYWIGWLRFDFNREHLNPQSQYWVAIESSGYTRNANTFYMSFALDWGFKQSNAGNALAMELFGYSWI